MKNFALVLYTFLVILVFTLIAAHGWAAPAFAQSQRDSCQFVEAGISQFNGDQNQNAQPMTVEMCIKMVDSSGAKLVRGFIANIGSVVVAAFLTLPALGMLNVFASAMVKLISKSQKNKRK